MNVPRASAEDYIQFPIASPSACSAAEAARVRPHSPAEQAHDAFTRLLTRLEPDPEALWAEVGPLLGLGGVLVIDDTALDKPYARKMDLVSSHWSGKHGAVVFGISLVTVVWSDGGSVLPIDYRVYHPDSSATEDDHFRAMLAAAHGRGLAPRCVLFDSWYASLENFKLVRDLGRVFLTRLEANRLACVGGGELLPPSRRPVAPGGAAMGVPGYGEPKVFRVTATDGGAENWATNEMGMTALGRRGLAEQSWAVEAYHRGLRQHTEVEKCQARLGRSQLDHIGSAIRAFVRLEWHRWTTGVGWMEAKAAVAREAVRAYLATPHYRLPQATTA